MQKITVQLFHEIIHACKNPSCALLVALLHYDGHSHFKYLPLWACCITCI